MFRVAWGGCSWWVGHAQRGRGFPERGCFWAPGGLAWTLACCFDVCAWGRVSCLSERGIFKQRSVISKEISTRVATMPFILFRYLLFSNINVIKMNMNVPPGLCYRDSLASLLTQGDQLT